MTDYRRAGEGSEGSDDSGIELFKMLVRAGAKPGDDFSYDMQTGAAQISDRAFEKLKAAYPNVDWAAISERVEVEPEVAAEHINNYLGIDFVTRILEKITQRIDELPAEQATWYLQQILEGVEQRTYVPLYVLLQRQLPLAKQVRLETLLRGRAIPCHEWMQDLIVAAGGEASDVSFVGEDAELTQSGLALLTAVWAGEYELIEDTDIDDKPEDDKTIDDKPDSDQENDS